MRRFAHVCQDQYAHILRMIGPTAAARSHPVTLMAHMTLTATSSASTAAKHSAAPLRCAESDALPRSRRVGMGNGRSSYATACGSVHARVQR
jgi:hypothetical protein